MDKNTLEKDQHAVKAELFETSFIEIVQKLAAKKKFKKGEFAREVWPESSALVSRNRWANMRGPDPKTGKPISCSLNDAYRMALSLGFQMPYLVVQAEALVEEKMEQIQHENEIKAKDKAPRQKK